MPKTTKTIREKISNVVAINTGKTKDGRPWTLFEVKIGEQTFRTFDGSYNEKIGQEGEWIYEAEERVSAAGKSYESRTLLPLSKAKKAEGAEGQELITKGFGLLRGEHQKISKEIEGIEFKLGQLENLLQAINIKVSSDKMPERPELKTFKNEVKDEDIPVVEDEPKF